MARKLAKTAIIAALYAALTLLLAPISYGIMQVRVSEALCVLAVFTPAAVPGLTLGCLLANLLGPYGLQDIIFGTLATFVGVSGMYMMRSRPMLAPICNVISNALIIGFELWYFFGLAASFWIAAAWVGLGELISCYVLGIPLMRYLRKNHERLGI
jgi:uncharacterized membrane protein